MLLQVGSSPGYDRLVTTAVTTTLIVLAITWSSARLIHAASVAMRRQTNSLKHSAGEEKDTDSLLHGKTESPHRKGTHLYASKAPFNEFLQISTCFSRPYEASWWARNAHVQIIMTLLIPQHPLKYQREWLHLKDGGRTSIDWAMSQDYPLVQDRFDAPIVVVCPGLTSSSVNMRTFCTMALKRGFRPVVFNKRGHGDWNHLSTPRMQTFGCVEDFKMALEVIEKAYPNATIYGVGFSAGSGLLVSYLGQVGEDSKIAAAVAVSPGYDAYKLFCGQGSILPSYNYLMTEQLKKLVRKHEDVLKDVLDMKKVYQSKSIQEFDELVYVQFSECTTLEEYWQKNNPMRQIHDVSVPVLCINSLDDPICTKGMIPYDLFEKHPNISLLTTEYGSHCAFYEYDRRTSSYLSWADEVALNYLEKHIEFTAGASSLNSLLAT